MRHLIEIDGGPGGPHKFLTEAIRAIEAAGGKVNTLTCHLSDVAFIEPFVGDYPIVLRGDSGCPLGQARLTWVDP